MFSLPLILLQEIAMVSYEACQQLQQAHPALSRFLRNNTVWFCRIQQKYSTLCRIDYKLSVSYQRIYFFLATHSAWLAEGQVRYSKISSLLLEVAKSRIPLTQSQITARGEYLTFAQINDQVPGRIAISLSIKMAYYSRTESCYRSLTLKSLETEADQIERIYYWSKVEEIITHYKAAKADYPVLLGKHHLADPLLVLTKDNQAAESYITLFLSPTRVLAFLRRALEHGFYPTPLKRESCTE